MPGAINSPVCWANGCGQDYTITATMGDQLQCAAVWQRPWQTPIGVMAQGASAKSSIQIQVSGEFRVPVADVYPSVAALPNPEALIGRRVYYDSYSGKYIVRDAYRATSYDPQALYPGSATIGCISDVTSTDVGITIDPQPPTATYVVGLASLPSTQWTLGRPVIVSADTNTVIVPTQDLTKFTGVIAGWLKPFIAPPLVPTPMIVVTSGPAWYPPNPDALYSISDRSELLSSPSTAIPIDIGGRACSLGIDNDNAIIGTIALNEWYDPDTQTMPSYVLLDVRGAA